MDPYITPVLMHKSHSVISRTYIATYPLSIVLATCQQILGDVVEDFIQLMTFNLCHERSEI